MKILTKFLIKRFLSGIGVVLGTISIIIWTITFVERMGANDGLWSTIVDAWTRLLEYIPLFLPLGIFMGTLLTLFTMTKSSEYIIISNAGRSPYQITRPFIIAAGVIGIFVATILNPYTVKLSNQSISKDNVTLVDDHIWLRETRDDKTMTLRAESIEIKQDQVSFENAVVYNTDKNAKPINRVDAKIINVDKTGIYANNAKITNNMGKTITGKWHTDTLLTPMGIAERYLKPSQISFWSLPGFIKNMNNMGLNPRGHLIQFWTLLFLPLNLIAMTALGIAFAQTRERRNYNFGTKFSMGVLACFGLYFITNLFTAFGTTGILPAFLSVVAPPMIIIAMAGIYMNHYDRI